MSVEPEISFCLPVYNSAERIERCLRAVLEQDVASREILVVDNASTDDTVARARALLAGIPEARVVVNERNLGRIENWNRCLELAQGRYLRFAMVNDAWLPGSAEMLWREAQARPEAVMVYARARFVQGTEAVAEPAPAHPPAQVFTSAEIIAHWCEIGHNDTDSLNTVLMRRDVIQRAGLRFRTDIPYWSDFYLIIELAAHGPVVYVPAESYLFFKALPGRFANAGLKPQPYYLDVRECSKLLGKLMAGHGRENWRGFGLLYYQYANHRVNFGNDVPLPGYRDTLALFKGSGPYWAKALKERAGRCGYDFRLWWWQMLQRIAIKCGWGRRAARS